MKTQNDIRYRPLYSLGEVSRYARVMSPTLRNWSRDRDKSIIALAGDSQSSTPFSFINLIEAHILVGMRRTHQVPMQKIKIALDWMKKEYNTAHPLAELNLETDGYNVFVRDQGDTINASRRGQVTFREIIARYLKRIERDDYLVPLRFYPFPNDNSPKTVVMDPEVVFGRPVIVGTRITTLMVYERFTGGESLNDIAHDYNLPFLDVEEALKCEIERRAA
jgi:uncharacterized protein (DUF433 family)